MIGTEGQEYSGREAKTAIVGRLAGRTLAQSLATVACDFYGDSLQFRESHGLPSSFYEIGLEHDSIALSHVRVGLQLGTDRVAAALSHEILHISLAMCGYPLPERVFVPQPLIPYANHLMGIQSIVSNLVEHELIFRPFLDLRFDKAEFLSQRGPCPRTRARSQCSGRPCPAYELLASRSCGCARYAEAVEFPWWCLEYLRHWLSARHGLDAVASLYADSALRWGSKVYPQLPQTARQMRWLIESGIMRDNRLYPDCVNRLLALMNLPEYSGWALIRPGRDGKPLAIRWHPAKEGGLFETERIA